ncbi:MULTISPECIES: WxL protein peptidoglycan domain-containing protein [unclassified Streptomyces]|uniref:WxL protein peptidoglycan domain-containing protein n=1 Tax=unclassified Streptomyces TaxID=2593676 RepID=UPI003D8A13DF
MITTSARRIAALLAACLLAVLPAAAASATAPATQRSDAGHGGTGRTTFGVQPSAAKKPDARPNFSYGATPGAIVKDHIAVFNYGTKPLMLRVYAQDAFTTADGGFDLYAAKRKPTDAGAWVKLDKNRVKIPARSRVIVPFTLTVPTKATPGDHTGGIVASLAASATDKKGNKVAVDQRVGARIYLRVAGEITSRLAVENLHTEYHGTANPFGSGSATVTYTVRNTGNVRLAAHQAVSVRDAFGGTATVAKLRDLPELLPGDAVTMTTTATGVFPAFRDTTTVTVDPQPVRGDVKFKILPRVTRTVAFSAVPWALLAVLLVLAGAATVWLVRRRRRRNPPTGAAKSTRTIGKKSGAKQAVGLAAVALLTAGAVVAGTPADAQAADGGKLAVTPAKGSDTEPISLTADAPCPAKTTNLIASVTGSGFPRGGQMVVGNSPLTAYTQVAGGGLAIPLTFTMRDYAMTAGFTTLRGTYTFTVSCLKSPFDFHSLRDFTGSLRFTGKTSYTDGTKVVFPKVVASQNPAAGTTTPGGTAVTPQAAPGKTGQQPGQPGQQSGQPAASAQPDSSGTPVAALPNGVGAGAAQESNSVFTAWSVAGFTVFLLALLAAFGLWVRGRRTRTEEPTAGTGD